MTIPAAIAIAADAANGSGATPRWIAQAIPAAATDPEMREGAFDMVRRLTRAR
jgi:hypothetical protein